MPEIDVNKLSEQMERARLATVAEADDLEALAQIDAMPPAHVVRPLPVQEGFRRLYERQQLARQGTPPQAGTEGDIERHAREQREADVVEAARRSQAEIRRHVDAYLKEHFETIAADIACVVVDQVHERLIKGVAAMQETQSITLDRIAADVRAQLRAFTRSAWGAPAPAKKARRAPKGPRRAAPKR